MTEIMDCLIHALRLSSAPLSSASLSLIVSKRVTHSCMLVFAPTANADSHVKHREVSLHIQQTLLPAQRLSSR